MWTSPHMVLAPALLTLIGPVLAVQGLSGSGAWLHRLLMLVGGLLLTTATVGYWIFVWFYIERPHGPGPDR